LVKRAACESKSHSQVKLNPIMLTIDCRSISRSYLSQNIEEDSKVFIKNPII